MATAVTNKQTVMLADDETEVVIRPLVIARLRRVFEAWGELEKSVMKSVEDGEDAPEPVEELDVFMNCIGICLETDLADKIDGQLFTGKDKTKVSAKYREFLENVIDREAIDLILKVCAGIDLKAMRDQAERVMAQPGPSST